MIGTARQVGEIAQSIAEFIEQGGNASDVAIFGSSLVTNHVI
ncbi:hypothetical protein [Photobacterium leiognathi]|nr:hypothetical protein [Photobacterium leiognathi]